MQHRRKTNKRNSKYSYDTLEPRRVLAAGVSVIDGSLLVSGEAEGEIVITAIDETTFEVHEAEQLVGRGEDVTGSISIQLDTTSDAFNMVTLDLNQQTVDSVHVNLGNGSNMFVIEDGFIERSLMYRGGKGADFVSITSFIEMQNAFVRIADGDDFVGVEGTIHNHFSVMGRAGDDVVQTSTNAEIGGSVHLRLGDGENEVSHEGRIDGPLMIRAGVDRDIVQTFPDSFVGGAMVMTLGDGNNAVTHTGIANSGFYLTTRGGNDTVVFGTTSSIAGNTVLTLGAAETLNSVTHSGTIGGDLSVLTMNSSDSYSEDETASIGGELTLDFDYEGRSFRTDFFKSRTSFSRT